MTTAKTPQPQSHFEMPDPPEDPEDKATSFDHLTITGSAHYLAVHLGNPDTTLIAGDRYLSPEPTINLAGLKFPDMLIAFGVNPEAYHRSNAYLISEQGKPPDFVMEIASRSTGREDVTAKRVAYAALGIPEYWRFDETGQYHGARLAGDRLVNGVYVPVSIEELAEGVLQGYSEGLDLHLRWEDGQLGWYDPATGGHILTYDDQRGRADSERGRADSERGRADSERGRADSEREARVQVEARVRELEAELRRLRDG